MEKSRAQECNPLLKRLQFNFNRSSVTKASEWACKYRVMPKPFPGPWNFKHHPWTREMHDAQDELIVGMKAAQMGYTEAAINRSFFALDVLQENVLYVFPSASPDAKDFTASRFNPALELSPHLQQLFSDVQNIGHKRAGSANFFIRGSRSRSQLKSLPAGDIVLDELEEHTKENIPLAFERASGQSRRRVFCLSTPGVPGNSIDQYFQESSQDHFFFDCPRCGRSMQLTLENLVITADKVSDSRIKRSHLICLHCKGILHHQLKTDFLADGVWQPTYTNRMSRGFAINQLYSTILEPYKIAHSVLKAKDSPEDETELYNSKLGLPHAVKGAQLDSETIAKCYGGEWQQKRTSSLVHTMGVDVGKHLHYWIDSWLFDGSIITSHAKTLKVGKCEHFEDLDVLMHDFRINHCVVDANPERRKALEFAKRFDGLVHLCFYSDSSNARELVLSSDETCVTVDRTSWLDMSLGRFRTERIMCPPLPEEAEEHLKNLVRVYTKDKHGNPVGRYVTPKGEDHFAHSRNYSEIALPLAVDGCGGCNITKRII